MRLRYTCIITLHVLYIRHSDYSKSVLYTLSFQCQFYFIHLTCIGGHDKGKEGIFIGPNGKPMAYSSWHPGEPNNVWNEDCVEMRKGGLWNDKPCYYRIPYICEKQKGKILLHMLRLQLNNFKNSKTMDTP